MTGMTVGWFTDPNDPTCERYWDGQRWSTATRPVTSGGAAPTAPTTEEPQPTRRRRWLIPAIIAGVVVVGAAVGIPLALSGGGGSSSFTVTGTFDLEGSPITFATAEDGNYFAKNKVCIGANGYEDINAGTQVTVSDETDKVVAIGHLAAGRHVSGGCEFRILVRNVPAGHKFYRVSVSHRGQIQYTEKQMRAGRVSLTLGP